MRVCDAQGRTRRRPRRRSDGGIEAVATLCKAGSAEARVGEHLNEATITRLGSILECGNMLSHPDCRATHMRCTRAGTRPCTLSITHNSVIRWQRHIQY